MSVASETRGPSDAPRSASRALLTLSDLPWLAVAVVAAVAVRVAWVAYVNVDPNDGRFDDSIFYHNVGRFLAEGHGYIDPWGRGPTAHWPPAYPAALAVVYKLFWWDLLWAKALNVGFAALTVVLVYVIALRLFDRRVAYVAALVIAFFPGQVYFATLIFSENMFAPVFLLVLVLTLVWTVQRPEARWWQLLVLGFLVGLAALVRAEGLVLAPVLVAVWAVTVRPWSRLPAYTALLAMGVALALTPWTVRNAVQLHEFIPIRPNSEGTLKRALDPDDPRPFQGLDEARSPGAGLRYALTHPGEMLVYTRDKLGDFYGHDDEGIFLTVFRRNPDPNPNYERPFSIDTERRWRNLADRYYYLAAGAGLAGAALCLLARRRDTVVLIAPVIGWTLMFAFFNPVSRYHFPLVPVAAIFAGVLLIAAWDAAGRYSSRWALGRDHGSEPAAADAVSDRARSTQP